MRDTYAKWVEGEDEARASTTKAERHKETNEHETRQKANARMKHRSRMYKKRASTESGKTRVGKGLVCARSCEHEMRNAKCERRKHRNASE